MWAVVTQAELSAATAELAAAAANGFGYCQAAFRPAQLEEPLGQLVLRFEGLVVKAHPTDLGMDWGFSPLNKHALHRTSRCVGGRLEEIE